MNETKPRLGKDEVDILQREFEKNPKPTTQTKRQFAEDMGVELSRINNWFQNRRAKRKQEKKQEAYDIQQIQKNLFSAPSSPDSSSSNGYFSDSRILPLRHSAAFRMSDSSLASAFYNPQYAEPSSTSVESLHRTLASAQAPALQQDFESNSSEQKSTLEIVESSLIQHASDQDDGESSAEETTKIERDFFDEADDQEEDVSGEDSCTSDNTEFFSSSYKNSYNDILRSVICEHNGDHNSLVLPILAPIRQNLVERIMDEFWLIFSQDWVAQIIRCPRDSSTSGDSKYRGTPVEKASLFKPQQKRQRSHEEDSPDGNDDKKPRRQRDGPRPLSKFNNLVRFGCPFRKHDPQRYSIHSHRVCALTPWDTIARVKEHLYRNHKALPYCKRCWKVFETEELLDSHATVPASSICEVLAGNPPEGITPKQMLELKSKAKPYSNQNEADRWKKIFRLLFPDESVPSPYWEPVQEYAPSSPNSQVLAHYDDYMHCELPHLFRSRVEEVVRREIQPVEASLLGNLDLVGLIRECQNQLSSVYRETHRMQQQPEVSSRQPERSSAGPINVPTTPGHLPMIAIKKSQQPSPDFFDAVLQPPPLEEDYELDFSACDAELFGPQKHTSSSSLSDSGYVSVPLCSCKESCRCLTSLPGLEHRDVDGDVDISDPSFAGLVHDLEAQAEGDQWQNWLEN